MTAPKPRLCPTRCDKDKRLKPAEVMCADCLDKIPAAEKRILNDAWKAVQRNYTDKTIGEYRNAIAGAVQAVIAKRNKR